MAASILDTCWDVHLLNWASMQSTTGQAFHGRRLAFGALFEIRALKQQLSVHYID